MMEIETIKLPAIEVTAEKRKPPACQVRIFPVPAVLSVAKKLCLALLLALTLTTPLQAKEAVPMAEDPVLEARLVRISDDLRCLVCQNESLSGSHADLAKDLRREIRGLIKAGKTDAEILDFMVARYGDFVLYRPPVKPTTWLLWGGPFVLLVGAVVGLLSFVRRRTAGAAASPKPAALSDAELQRANSLLGTAQTTNSRKETQP